MTTSPFFVIIKGNLPFAFFFAILINNHNVSIKANRVLHVESFNLHLIVVYLPRISFFKPIIRHFNLIPIHDFLLKNSVIVSDSVAPCRVVQGC